MPSLTSKSISLSKLTKSPKKSKKNRKWIPLSEFINTHNLSDEELSPSANENIFEYDNVSQITFYNTAANGNYIYDQCPMPTQLFQVNQENLALQQNLYDMYHSQDSYSPLQYIDSLENSPPASDCSKKSNKRSQSFADFNKLLSTYHVMKRPSSDKSINYTGEKRATFNPINIDPNNSCYFIPTDYTVPVILPSPIYPVAFDINYRAQKIVDQLSYYFSISNLCKDLYLRKLIDANGGIKLTELLKFNRLKILTNNGSDIELLTSVINENKSQLGVELINDQTAVRLVNWKQWSLNPQ